jgi:hypothetical protein
MKCLIEITSNAGFRQFYNPPLSPPSSHALVNFSGERTVVAVTVMAALEE